MNRSTLLVMFSQSWKKGALVVMMLHMKNGFRTIHPKAGLRLDTYEAKVLDNTAVEAGNLADSYLYEV